MSWGRQAIQGSDACNRNLLLIISKLFPAQSCLAGPSKGRTQLCSPGSSSPGCLQLNLPLMMRVPQPNSLLAAVSSSSALQVQARCPEGQTWHEASPAEFFYSQFLGKNPTVNLLILGR